MYHIDNVVSNTWDYKVSADEVVEDVLKSVNELLERKGLPTILTYNDPQMDGSDQYGYLFSMDELSEAEVDEASRDIWDTEDVDVEEMDELGFDDESDD